MPTISELVVKITGDASGLNKSVGDAEKRLKTFGFATEELATLIGPAVLGAAFIATAKSISDYIVEVSGAADVIDKTSLRTGIATDELQKYKYAAEQSGVSFGSLTSTISIMTRGLETNSDTFKALGIETKNADGSLRSTQDIFNETVNVLSEMSNETERNQVALQLFGRGAAELTPLLAQGSRGIQDLKDRSEKLGLIMSQDLVNAGVKFGDITNDLKNSVKALGLDMASNLLPPINNVVEGLTNMIIKFVSGKAGIKEFQEILKNGVKETNNYELSLNGANEQLRVLGIQREQAVRAPEFAEKSVEEIDKEVEKIKALKRELVELMKGRKANSEFATEAAKTAADNAAKELAAAANKSKTLDAAAQKIVDNINDENAAITRSLEYTRKKSEEDKKASEDKQQRIDQMNKEIEEAGKKEWEAEKEKNEKIKELDKKRTDEAKAEEEKRLANIKAGITSALGSIRSMFDSLTQYMSAYYQNLQDQIDEALNSSLFAIDAETQAKLAAAGLSVQTELERLQAEYDAAVASGDMETANELAQEIARTKIIEEGEQKKKTATETAEKEKAKIKYKADLASWNSQLLLTIVDAAAAIVKGFAQLGPIGGAIAAAGTAAVTAANIAVMNANKPTAPKFARGTDFAPGGESIINEEGAEVVNLPRGSEVIPVTRKMAGQGGSGISVVINSPIALNPSEAASVFKQTARELAFVGAL